MPFRPVRQLQGDLGLADTTKTNNGGFPPLLTQEQHLFKSVQRSVPSDEAPVLEERNIVTRQGGTVRGRLRGCWTLWH